jgi:signal transduction histidine kinase
MNRDSLGTWTLLRLGVLLLAFAVVMLSVSVWVLEQRFDSIERTQVEQQLRQAVVALDRDVDALRRAAIDYARWDVTYGYLAGDASPYIANNFDQVTVPNLGLDLVLLLDTALRPVDGARWPGMEPGKFRSLPLEADLRAAIMTRVPTSPRPWMDLIWYGDQPLLLTGAPVELMYQQSPSNGWLVFGRFLSGARLDELQQLTQLPFSLEPADAGVQEQAAIVESVAGWTARMKVKALPLVIVLQRDYALGADRRATYLLLLLNTAVLSVLLLAGIMVLLRRRLLLRLANFSALARRFLLERNTLLRWPVTGRDELDDLAMALNGLLQSLAEEAAQLKQLKQELEILNADLEQRVEQRTAELSDARDQAEAANRAKSRFLSHMSHELRTPLNGVLGFAQLLRLKPLDEEDKASVEEIFGAGKHLLGLIDELLDLSRIEAGRFDLAAEAVFVDEIVQECRNLLEPLARERGIAIRAAYNDTAGLAALCDRKRLRQVVLNLVGNAIKYNRNGGSVELRTSITPDHCWRLTVIDSGVGIADAEQHKVFRSFSRMHHNIGVEGAGIGLVISKHLIQLMGGRIDFSSIEGTGSIFWIDLPLAAECETVGP